MLKYKLPEEAEMRTALPIPRKVRLPCNKKKEITVSKLMKD